MAKCSSDSRAGPRRSAKMERSLVMRVHMIWCWCAVCAVCAAGSAWCEDLAGARACVGIADKAARLACFDAAFAPPTAPAGPAPPLPAARVTSAPPTAAAVPTAPAAAVDRFGDNGQLQPELSAKASLPKKLDLKVVTAVPLGRGLYRLTLDNGQIWETRQADWALEFKSGDAVTVSRMILNSYQISLAGQGRSVGVKRVQ